MTKIQIQKRNSEEVACWRVDAEKVTPNTVIETDGNLTVLVKIDGVTKVQMRSSATVYSLFTPGKTTKMFGGNTPYQNIEIYAIDQSSEFNAEWGLAGNNAIPCFDRENNVDCHAVAFGEYFYKIENFVNFINTLPVDKNGEITRADIREFLRAETAGVIKAFLTNALGSADIKVCQGRLAEYAEDIKEKINKHLDSKGLTVYNFVIGRLSYDSSHQAKRNIMNDVRMGVNINKISNEGKLDNIRVEREKANIEIDLIKAHGEANAKSHQKSEKNVSAVFCTRCGTKNEDALYCKRCGEKLSK